MRKLTHPQIKAASDGKLEDGGGLKLIKKGDKGKWVWRYQRLGRRREMGLGAYPSVSLADARKARDLWAGILASGKDPLDVRRAEQESQRELLDRDDPPFAQLVDMVFEAKKEGLRGEGIRGRWRSPLDTHIIPRIGQVRGSELNRHQIFDALKPIWRTKHPTALKALRRTRMVLTSARRMGFPTDPEITYSAEEMLGIHQHQPERIAAVPWRDIPGIYQKLPDTIGGRCNAWMMMTLVRMHGCIGARVSEVDLETGIWTVPAERIKGQKGMVQDFRVPLTEPCLKIVREIAVFSDLIFPGIRGTSPITNVGVAKVLKTMGVEGTPHGYRTSFRTWVQDTDACAWEVSETILGHVTGGTVERAYARSDLLERRRPVMKAWSDFVTGGRPEEG